MIRPALGSDGGRKKKPVDRSLEDKFLMTWMAVRGRQPWPQFQFHPDRKWRLDFAFRPEKVAIEVHGGVWKSGRHTRGSGFIGDRQKMNAAAMLGWRVIELTPEMIQPAYLEEIRDAFELRYS